ncbi:MAG: large-conductance mechanosensitive channel protein MscL [Clostridia bacterium]|nr:large-conductance mechanosensitive channel protein MscL [Clostridia bacterium]MDD4571773.1 large-conductance mechanosensitive channel protein MscL [Clostridia bacterium]
MVNEKAKNLSSEFKNFIMRGNVVDMAVGVIIGTAFGKIITSLVNDLLMPLLSLLIGKVNFTDLAWVITPASEGVEEVAFCYGAFIQNVIDFVIIAASIFLFIKLLGSMRRKKEEAPADPPEPSKEELLLTEIRDILKDKA